MGSTRKGEEEERSGSVHRNQETKFGSTCRLTSEGERVQTAQSQLPKLGGTHSEVRVRVRVTTVTVSPLLGSEPTKNAHLRPNVEIENSAPKDFHPSTKVGGSRVGV